MRIRNALGYTAIRVACWLALLISRMTQRDRAAWLAVANELRYVLRVTNARSL